MSDVLDRLGIPGLFDVHVHFLPANIQAAVWREFDQAGPKIGRPWPILYRGSVTERVEQLRSFGVRRFTALPYAHKPGVAGYLNDWAAGLAAEVPECLASATFYPEPGVGEYVADLVAGGVEVFKLHTQVGEFLLDDPLLDPAWEQIAAARIPVVTHVGSGPVGNAFTGPQHLERLLAKHPDVRIVVAHLGAPEFAEFLDLAERNEHTYLDTTMVFTEFFVPFPPALVPRLTGLGDKILYGSDFPNLPYEYAHQLEGLERLLGSAPGLDDDWLARVCWHNADTLFGATEI
ncbi:amidohydrolase family protein [Nocardioides marmorisolisilvae]|uniref:Amidohydrolase n=1 Tax=Nocardioides marmorisolisilvae TaxID=1542737 RepID=A0A3N0DSR0_9ACTN|nr:amidohydrolase family protein [Nocardioides marmorisolisilvae]RNL78685.1 amidohydrolase [Nocardioides marmorisolisilvae]